MQLWGDLVKFARAPFFHTLLEKPTASDLTSRHFSNLPRSGGRKGFGVGFLEEKLLFFSLIFMPLVNIPETLSKEVGGMQ